MAKSADRMGRASSHGANRHHVDMVAKLQDDAIKASLTSDLSDRFLTGEIGAADRFRQVRVCGFRTSRGRRSNISPDRRGSWRFCRRRFGQSCAITLPIVSSCRSEAVLRWRTAASMSGPSMPRSDRSYPRRRGGADPAEITKPAGSPTPRARADVPDQRRLVPARTGPPHCLHIDLRDLTEATAASSTKLLSH